jgi:hypothetical protein
VDGLIWWSGTKKNRCRSRVALIIPHDPLPVPPWRTPDSLTAKAPKIEKGSGLEWKILDLRARKSHPDAKPIHLGLERKKGRAGQGSAKQAEITS